MTRIGSPSVLTLKYSPYKKIGKEPETALSRVKSKELTRKVKEALSKPKKQEKEEAVKVKVRNENNRKVDADIASKALPLSSFQQNGILELENIVSRQKEIVSTLSKNAIGSNQSTALQSEFSTLVTEYNRVYSTLSNNAQNSPSLFKDNSLQLNLNLDKKLSYNSVEITSNFLTINGGAGTTTTLVDNVNQTDTGLTPSEGIDASYNINTTSLGAVTNLQGGEETNQIVDSGISIQHSESFSLSYNPTVTAITADSSTNIFSGDFTALYTGKSITLADLGGLPEGLDPAAEYYLIKLNDSEAQLAAVFEDAFLGIEIDLSEDITQGGFRTYAVDSSFDINSDSLNISTHGYETGNTIVFQDIAGNTLPDGLEANRVYYVIELDDANFRLAESLQDAMSNNWIEITNRGISDTGTMGFYDFVDASGTAYDDTENSITQTSHGLSTGDRIRISTPGSLAHGLSEDTDYYVIKIDDDTFKFAASYSDALSNTEVDFSGVGYNDLTISLQNNFDSDSDSVYIGNHGYSTGDRIRFSGDDLPDGITADQDYYVIVNDNDSFRLAESYLDATSDTNIDFTTNGTGAIDLTPVISPINQNENSITLTSHGLTSGNRIRFTTESGTLPDGISTDTDYYVIVEDADTIKLALSQQDVIDDISINILGSGSGEISISAYADGAFNSHTNEITLAGHGLSNGQVFQFTGDGDTPAGLDKDTNYYAIVTGDPDVFKVAATYQDALDEVAIEFNDAGSGNVSLSTFESQSAFDSNTNSIFVQDHGLATGQRIQFSSLSGNLPTGISSSVDYYVIAIDADNFQLALSASDAASSTEINFSGNSSGKNYLSVLGASDFDSNTDSINIAGHNLTTGQRVTFSGSGFAALPTGINDQSYYVIRQDANTIKLASSKEDAALGNSINIRGLGAFNINLEFYNENLTASTGTQGEFDLNSRLGLLSAEATLNNISTKISFLKADSAALNSRLKGISLYSENEKLNKNVSNFLNITYS